MWLLRTCKSICTIYSGLEFNVTLQACENSPIVQWVCIVWPTSARREREQTPRRHQHLAASARFQTPPCARQGNWRLPNLSRQTTRWLRASRCIHTRTCHISRVQCPAFAGSITYIVQVQVAPTIRDIFITRTSTCTVLHEVRGLQLHCVCQIASQTPQTADTAKKTPMPLCSGIQTCRKINTHSWKI